MKKTGIDIRSFFIRSCQMTDQRTKCGLPHIAVVVPPGPITYSDWRVRMYFNALIHGGAFPFALPLTLDEEVLAFQLAGADGLLITGGLDIDPEFYGGRRDPQGKYDPDFDRYGSFVYRTALKNGMPVLGICRGLQVMNVFSGGTLIPDVAGHQGETLQHPVNLSGTLAALYGGSEVMVNSFHHQVVERPGSGFRVTAMSSDGYIEAIEYEGLPFVVGVQWHPERMTDQGTSALFREFGRQCILYRRSVNSNLLSGGTYERVYGTVVSSD